MVQDYAKNALPAGTRLEAYTLNGLLAANAFALTYRAQDSQGAEVAIKEYLPAGLAARTANGEVAVTKAKAEADFRWGRERFLDEAKAIERFRHSAIVRVMRSFTAKGTAYMVMEHVRGETLSQRLEASGRLTEGPLGGILFPLLNGLEALHRANFLHHGITPATIILREEDGSPVLIGFGGARCALERRIGTLQPQTATGYAPWEVYVGTASAGGRNKPAARVGGRGPWTDIYALAAVAYHGLSASAPQSAGARAQQDRLRPAVEACRGRASPAFLRALDWALSLEKERRPQTAAVWRRALASESSPENVRTRQLVMAGAAAMAIVATTGILYSAFQPSATGVVENVDAATRTWEQTLETGTTNAYYAYLTAHPHGLHSREAGRRIAEHMFWQQRLGGSDEDDFQAAVALKDGGVLLVGQTESQGEGGDGWLVKMDARGRLEWERAVGGRGKQSFLAAAADDDTLLVAGFTSSTADGGLDGWLVKLDGSGNQIWQRNYGAGGREGFSAVVMLDEGDALLAGSTMQAGGEADGWVVRIDEAGAVLWQRTLGGTGRDVFSAVASVEGGIFLAGRSNSTVRKNFDGWIVRMDKNGNTLWERMSGSETTDSLTAAAPLDDGGVLLAGHNRSKNSQRASAWVMRVKDDGEVLWQHRFTRGAETLARAILPLSDGGALLAGRSRAADGDAEATGWLLRIDDTGAKMWESIVDSGMQTRLRSVVTLTDRGLLLAGQVRVETDAGDTVDDRFASQRDGWVVRLPLGVLPAPCDPSQSAMTAELIATYLVADGLRVACPS